MNTATYTITGGDYDNGGAASKQLKEMLKRIGADPHAVRRTMIAAYEAEMNVVIHARRGVMQVAVDPSQVDVAVADEGPGIPDIEKAMTEGFSTAPAVARELGFGAGMGLPNIRKNSDRFSIQSTGGRGTSIRFSIYLANQQTTGAATNSIHVVPERCRQCLKCLHVCPTYATRVRNGAPIVLEHLCVDCTACIAACEPGALAMDCPSEIPPPTGDTVLVLPSSFLAQFGAGVMPKNLLDMLDQMGFHHVRVSGEWEEALRQAVVRYAETESKALPVLPPVCPAVINLIQVRFPSLLPHAAPFLAPMDAAREELRAPDLVFVPACPSQYTILQSPSVLNRIHVVAAQALRCVLLAEVNGQTREMINMGTVSSRGDVLEVSGIRHVMKVLDKLEDGLLEDYRVIELYACDQGCFGAPVWTEDPFVGRRRYELDMVEYRSSRDARLYAAPATAIRRTSPLEPRAGMRLDTDMAKAIEKLARIDAATRGLPGRDCGACGAPTCASLAEDIVLGRADVSACPYIEHDRPTAS